MSLLPKGKGPRSGAYSKGYARKRQEKGFGTGRVDLTFTRQLSKSIQVGKLKGHAALLIKPGTRSGKGKAISNIELADHLEKTYKTEIFAAGDREAEAIAKATLKRLDKDAEKFIDQCFPKNAEIKI